MLALGCAGMTGLHACKTLVGIMKDVEESLDGVSRRLARSAGEN